MSDGLVQFLHRKIPPSLAEREAERLKKKPSHRYLQFTHFETAPDDIIIKEDKKFKGMNELTLRQNSIFPNIRIWSFLFLVVSVHKKLLDYKT